MSVLLPARDEAHRIAPCISSVLASRGVPQLELIVLDDASRDATAAVATAAADGDPRVVVRTGAPVSTGWLGKPHACAQLAAMATGDTLVFVDADVRLAPDGLAGTVALLEEADLDLVSHYPRQEAEGWLPRLVQPLLQWSWLTFAPLEIAERVRHPSFAVANGQLLVCRAAAYERSGGHAAVRDAVLDDLALARAFVAAGARVAVADGTRMAVCRMYDDAASLRDGYTKSLWAAFGSRTGAGVAAALLAWCYLLPPAHAIVQLTRGRARDALPGLLGYGAGVAGRVVVARHTGARIGDAAAHPLSISALLVLLADSWRRKRGGQLAWKGRRLNGASRG